MLEPLLDRIIVEPVKKEDRTESGIILPDLHRQEKRKKQKLVEVGKDCETIKKDDLVLYPKYSGTEITHNGQDVLIVSEKEMLRWDNG